VAAAVVVVQAKAAIAQATVEAAAPMAAAVAAAVNQALAPRAPAAPAAKVSSSFITEPAFPGLGTELDRSCRWKFIEQLD